MVYDDLDALYVPGPFSRVTYRAAPHNAYLSLTALRTAAVRRSFSATASITGLAFAGTVAGARRRRRSRRSPSRSRARTRRRLVDIRRGPRHDVSAQRKQEEGHRPRRRRAAERAQRCGPVDADEHVRQRWRRAENEVTLEQRGERWRRPCSWAVSGTTGRGAPARPARGSCRIAGAFFLDPGDTWFEVIGNDAHIVMN